MLNIVTKLLEGRLCFEKVMYNGLIEFVKKCENDILYCC